VSAAPGPGEENNGPSRLRPLGPSHCATLPAWTVRAAADLSFAAFRAARARFQRQR
jgi:hypothetical protein